MPVAVRRAHASSPGGRRRRKREREREVVVGVEEGPRPKPPGSRVEDGYLAPGRSCS